MTQVNIWSYDHKFSPVHRKENINFVAKDEDYKVSVDYEGHIVGQFFSAHPNFNRSWLNYKVINKDRVQQNQNNFIVIPIFNYEYQNDIPKLLYENDNLIKFAVINNVKIICCYLRENLTDSGELLHCNMKRYKIYQKIYPDHLNIYVNGYGNSHVLDQLKPYVKHVDVFDKIMYRHTLVGKLNIDQIFDVTKDMKHKFSFLFGTLKYRPYRVEGFRFLIDNNLIDRDDIFFTTITFDADKDKIDFLIDNHSFKIKSSTRKVLKDYGLEKIFVHKVYNEHGERYDPEDIKVRPAVIKYAETPPQVLQSCVQVCFETRPNQDSITEKVYRPLFLGQPFLWHARENLMSYLTSLGYKFYPWIDYSFDSISDPYLRLEAMFKEIKRLDSIDLIKMIRSTVDINDHNRSNFLKRMTLTNEFDQIIK